LKDYDVIVDQLIKTTNFLAHTTVAERRRALLVATKTGDVPPVEFWLDHGHCQNTGDFPSLNELLSVAAAHDRNAALCLLLDRGADIESAARTSSNEALHSAAAGDRE
jgi:hypothetical protein